MTAGLHIGAQNVVSPRAVLNSPGLAVVYLTERGVPGTSWLAFADPADARQLAAAITHAAELLEGPQLVGET